MTDKTFAFIEKANLLHNNFYNYDAVVYLNSKTKVKILCPLHEYFYVTPNDHLSKLSGCPKCASSKRTGRPSTTTAEALIQRFREIHGDVFSYTFTEDFKVRSYVDVTCKTHGVFKLKIQDHLKGVGCKYCFNKRRQLSESVINQHIKTASEFFSNKYDYSKVLETYKSSASDVTITCPVHGDLSVNFRTHFIEHSGCRFCLYKSKYLTTADFVLKSKSMYDNKYAYSLVNYGNYNNLKVTLYCNQHGNFFEQTPKTHLAGHLGCLKCQHVGVSKAETEIVDYIKSLFNTEILTSYRPEWLSGKELDIFIPEYNLAIEYNGTLYHHSSKSLYCNSFALKTTKDFKYHYSKWLACKLQGIRLISIYDFKYLHNKDKYFSLIRHCLQLSTRVFARKLELRLITNDLAKDFHIENHFEGFNVFYKNPFSYGLYDKNNTLYLVATFGEYYDQASKLFKLKLQRISTLKDYCVVGGLSKISKNIYKSHGDFVYQTTNDTGSIVDGEFVSLRYYWVNLKNLTYLSRNQTQKNLLPKLLDTFNSSLTENENMENAGYLKVYDSGLTEIKFNA